MNVVRSRLGRGLAATACLITLSASPTRAGGSQGDDIARRLEVLEAGQKELLRQLQDLKALVQQGRAPAQPPPTPIEAISIAGSATRGNASAGLTIVEFSDFQCPFCGRYARETLEQLQRDYVSTGKVRYVFRHFPLEQIHRSAFKAALAGECALQQGKFWELHDRLFANQQALSDLELLSHAKAVGMSASAFQGCVVSPASTLRIREDLEAGARAGITGTPTFFLGTLQKDGRLKVLRRLPGAVPYAAFRSAIDGLLASLDPQR